MELSQKYNQIRDLSQEIVKPLKTEDFVVQAAMFASPPKWNLGHTTWFFEELVLKHFYPGYRIYHEMFDFIFNSYYNTFGSRVQRDHRGFLSRPVVEEVMQYRAYVDKHMQELIASGDIPDDLNSLIILGLNHEQQHQELFFTDLKYNFSVNPLFPAYSDIPYCEDENSGQPGYIHIRQGNYQIGYIGNGFCYDNELQAHQVYLQEFEINNHLVTNGEFMEFIGDGGYERFDFWHDDGLAWKRENKITKPLYWVEKNNDWYQYTLAGLRKINTHSILSHISYYEAFAYAQWKGMRLPTEFEWEVAAPQLNWGKRWEWTESAYLPYPGYKRGSGAVSEYNGKFMVNQKVLRGASVATPLGHSRITYRNFFHPHIAYQFSGIRLVK